MRDSGKIIFLLLVMIAAQVAVYGQVSSNGRSRIKRAEAETVRLQRELLKLRNESARERKLTEEKLRSIEERVGDAQSRSEDVRKETDVKLSQSADRYETRYSAADVSISRLHLYLAGVATMLVGLSAILFVVVNRRMRALGEVNESKIQETRRSLDEENVRLDQKLVELMAGKLSEQRESQNLMVADDEPDHSLALKVADEIVRIERNLSAMDPALRGRKQLVASVERIRDNFAAKGYEIVAMLGKPYDEGMKVIANFKPDDSLPDGVRIISRIVKPQVNFRGTMIQAAQIEVSQG